MNYWSERPSGSQTIPTIVISLGSSPQLDGKTLLGKTQDSVAGRDRQARELLSSFLFSYPAIPRQLLVHSPWPWINGSQTFIKRFCSKHCFNSVSSLSLCKANPSYCLPLWVTFFAGEYSPVGMQCNSPIAMTDSSAVTEPMCIVLLGTYCTLVKRLVIW